MAGAASVGECPGYSQGWLASGRVGGRVQRRATLHGGTVRPARRAPRHMCVPFSPHAKTVVDTSSAQQNQYNPQGMYGAMSPMYGMNAGPQAYFQGPQNDTL